MLGKNSFIEAIRELWRQKTGLPLEYLEVECYQALYDNKTHVRVVRPVHVDRVFLRRVLGEKNRWAY